MNNYNETRMQNTLKECSALVFTIIFIWSLACGNKGVWPLGQMLFDVGDMAEECVPMYTHLWDVLHGQKSLFFDWYTGLGNNMAGSVLYFGLISPFNIFFLFIKRSAIEASMSIYILFKLTAMGFSMHFLLRKWFPGLSMWMYFSFSVLYVFSAFNMQYYYAPMWLDVSFMFPIVIYGYFLLMNEGKKIPYIICLALTCMMSFQHTYMLFLMLLFLTGLLPLFSRKKYQVKLPELLGSTLLAMMLAAWIWIPGAIQILHASRAEANHSFMEIWSSVWIFFTAKWMKLLNMGLPISFFLIYVRKHYKEKGVKFFSFVMMLVCAPILLESTNLLWHGGSYQGYTMRFSYMVAFWILTAGAYAYQKKDVTEEDLGCRKEIIVEKRGKNQWIVDGMGGIGILLLTVASGAQYFLLKNDETVYKKSVPAAAIILIVGICIIGGCGIWHLDRAVREKAVFITVIIQSLILATTSILISGEKENSSFAMLEEAVKDVERKENVNPISRIKSLDVELSHNYPLVMRKNAISNYTGVNSKKQLDGVINLGYAQVGYRMSDYGGTLFSDALLGINQIISEEDVNGSLYEYEAAYGDYKVYKNLYGYEQGIKIKKSPTDGSNMESNPFARQNYLAEEVTGGELFDIIAVENDKAAIKIDEESVLYFYGDNEENLEKIIVTDLGAGEVYELVIPESGWLNGILELGVWRKADLKIEIRAGEPVGKIFFAVLPLRKFVENKPGYFKDFEINGQDMGLIIRLDGAEKKDSLFLPLYHDEGWTCIVNGKKTVIEEFADAFMLIPLQEGRNEVELSFRPPGLRVGICATVLGLFGLIAAAKCPVEYEWKRTGRILWVLDEIIFSSLLLIFYVIPAVFLVAWIGKLWIK